MQEQGAFLKQQLAAVFDQLKAKDAQLNDVQQQLQQAQHAQQAQYAQQAQRTQRSQSSDQHFRQDTAQEGSYQAGADMVPTQTLASSSTLHSASQRFPSYSPHPVTARYLHSQSVIQSNSPEQPELQAVATHSAEAQDVTDVKTPRHQFVAQRIMELQSRQSSPEKTLSCTSSMGVNSPRAGLRGEFDRSTKVGLFGDAISSPRPRPAGNSPQAGQPENNPRAGLSEAALTSLSDSTDAKEAIQRAFDTSPRAVASGLTPQQSRRVTSASDVSDGLGALSSARRGSRSTTPPQGRLSPDLQRISPRSGLQVPSDANQANTLDDDESLAWGTGVEYGSPGIELGSDGDSEAGGRSRDNPEMATAVDHDYRVTGALGAVLREDSAQFGPEASAMSLPGAYHILNV